MPRVNGGCPGIAQIFFVIPVFGQIGLGIKPADGHAGDGGEARVAVLVEVYARSGANGLFRGLFQRRRQRGLSPLLLAGRGVAAFKNVRNGCFRNVTLELGFTLICHKRCPSRSSSSMITDQVYRHGEVVG